MGVDEDKCEDDDEDVSDASDGDGNSEGAVGSRCSCCGCDAGGPVVVVAGGKINGFESVVE